MMADGDENSDDSVSVSFYSQKQMPMPIQIQAKPTTLLRFRTVTEESKLTNRHKGYVIDILRYHLTVLHPVMGKHPDLMVGPPTPTIFPTNDRNFERSQFFEKIFEKI
jgi:hypothetical protein